MKQNVVIFLALLLLSNSPAPAEGFRLEAGHFTVNGGPLTVSNHSSLPLPDGCRGQILADTSGDGIAPPRSNGMPGEGDALLSDYVQLISAKEDPALFAVNGQSKMSSQGSFLSATVECLQLPARMICLRVFNATDPALATAYWDSPTYRVVAGPQQVSFDRNEWTYHPFSPAGISGGSAMPEKLAMNAFPNPFNSTSRIEFSLERPSEVELSVFDIQGRLVRTLVSELRTTGNYTVLFDAGMLTSGVYFLRMQRDGQQAFVKRLHLIR
jgi:hypothetical protein